jgi:hypothetical protein
VAVLVLWAGVTLVAFGYFWLLDAIPGHAAAAPSSIANSTNHPTVLLFLHPKCPCSRATLAELGQVAAKVERPVKVRVYFTTPDEADNSWRTSSLCEQAARLPNATVAADPRGAEAKRHGVTTSGQVLAYDTEGKLTFAGGITGSRGHEGDNDGRSRLIAALDGRIVETPTAPVYGCRLVLSAESPRTEVPQ